MVTSTNLNTIKNDAYATQYRKLPQKNASKEMNCNSAFTSNCQEQVTEKMPRNKKQQRKILKGILLGVGIGVVGLGIAFLIKNLSKFKKFSDMEKAINKAPVTDCNLFAGGKTGVKSKASATKGVKEFLNNLTDIKSTKGETMHLSGKNF